MRRREFIAGLGGKSPAWPLAAHAANPRDEAGANRILGQAPAAQLVDRVEIFRTALRDLGYLEGKGYCH